MSEDCKDCEAKIKLLKGPRGPKGERGLQGERGDVGATGATGQQGQQGERGDIGPRGFQGEQGPAGSNGLNGGAGVQGEQGIQGLTGPTGPKGDKGDKGDTGDTGPAGADGSGAFEDWQQLVTITEWLAEVTPDSIEPKICKNPSGLTLLKGGVYKEFGGTFVGEDLVAVFPVGYRPISKLRFPVYWERTGGSAIDTITSNGFMTATLESNGELRVSVSALSSQTTKIDLSSIIFRSEL